MDREKKLREKARELLESKEVDLVIGYGWTRYGKRVAPVFITRPEDVDRLIWNPMCVNNLTLYITRKYPDVKAMGRPAVVVKGCDAKTVNVLIQEGQLKREDVVLLGIPCEGVVYRQELYDGEVTKENVSPKCVVCDVKNPPLYDHLIGEKVEEGSGFEGARNIYQEIEELDKKPEGERWAFWMEHFERCIRCYACRQICPLCYCERCIAEKNMPQWIDTSAHGRGNVAWNLKRAMDLAGRCVFCGECERACPVNIPLNLINQKLSMVVEESFNHRPGYESEGHPPLIVYSLEDREDFIR